MTEQEIIDVVQHFRDGGEVQTKHKGGWDWSACGDPRWNFQTHEYRKKPKPKTRLMTAEELKGKWVMETDTPCGIYQVTAINPWDKMVFLSGWHYLDKNGKRQSWIPVETLIAEGWVLEDGSPLTVEVGDE